VTEARGSTQLARLARMGFANTQACQDILTNTPVLDAKLEFVKDSPDPDASLAALAKVVASGGIDIDSLAEDKFRDLATLLGSSVAIAENLERHPSQINYALETTDVPTSKQMLTDLLAAVSTLSWDEALLALRIAYRRQVCAIAAVDLRAANESTTILPGIAQALSDLADAVIASALVIARSSVKDDDKVRIAVIAMGKCGARELNYVSDVDVMFVVEPASGATDEEAITIGSEIAKAVIQACSAVTSEGTIWDVDAALRPEGKSGALVRTWIATWITTIVGLRPGSTRRYLKLVRWQGTLN
jgi:[glutamine synthetase] adenylyltransferase / [glutamine synthetase]-adenylyl-L-tyrosine phosphorylase